MDLELWFSRSTTVYLSLNKSPLTPVLMCLLTGEGLSGGTSGKEPTCLPADAETWVWSLSQEDPLEEGLATHSSILAWRMPKDRGAWLATVQSMESDRVGHDWSNVACTHTWERWLRSYNLLKVIEITGRAWDTIHVLWIAKSVNLTVNHLVLSWNPLGFQGAWGTSCVLACHLVLCDLSYDTKCYCFDYMHVLFYIPSL